MTPLILTLFVVGIGSARAKRRHLPPMAVIRDPQLPIHVALVEALTSRAGLPRTVVLNPGESWPLDQPPTKIVTLGARAREDAERRWPLVERAQLLSWTPRAQPTTLWISAQLEPLCTAQRLHDAAGPEHWLVIAAKGDKGAAPLAEALSAAVFQGSPSEITRHLLVHPPRAGTKLWVRVAPQLAQPIWLARLGALGRLTDLEIGAFGIGVQRYGFSSWVQPDLDAIASEVATWASATRRAKRRTKRVQAELPCARG